MASSIEHAAEVAASLTDKHLQAKLKNLKQIEGLGEVNQVYEVVAGRSKAILRMHDFAEYGRYKKEEWCINAALKNGVPTAEVLYVGHDEECAYMLLEFISGNNNKDVNDTPQTWYTLGQYLRRIHEIPVRGFGESLDDITKGSVEKWHSYVRDNINALSNDKTFIEISGLKRNQILLLTDLFKDLSNKNLTLGLNHGDYSIANVITHEGIPYIIDWGSARAHIVPHYDLGIILEESLQEDDEKFAALLSGYKIIRQDYEAIREEIASIQLLDAVDKVRWSLDKAPNRTTHHLTRLTKFLKEV